jgi:peptidylamidoglycolate lyase
MNNYRLAEDWPDLAGDFELGNPTGIGLDSNQDIFIFHRAARSWTEPMPDSFISSNTILMLARDSGKILNTWGDNLFIMPHGLTVDADNNVWVTDVGLHQVFKFNHDGKLLLKIGEAKIPGNDSTHFNLPTDVAVTREGSFYVSDGYGNNRIVKFSSTGAYLFEWGEKGHKKGEFNLPHAIDLDDEENVYVADRENNRVQVFSPTGKFIKELSDERFGKISSIAFYKEKKGFIAVDYTTSPSDTVEGSEIISFDSFGNVISKSGATEGAKCWYHNVAIDNEENIYVTDIIGNRIRKFIKVLR